MITRAQLGLHAKDDLQVVELVAIQYAARNFGTDAIVVACRVRDVDQLVVGELGMQRDIHQSALSKRGDGRQAFYRSRFKFEILADHAQSACSLGHQHAAIGQKRQAPWMLQTRGELRDADAMFFGVDALCLHSGEQAQSQYWKIYHKYLILNNYLSSQAAINFRHFKR